MMDDEIIDLINEDSWLLLATYQEVLEHLKYLETSIIIEEEELADEN